MRPKTKDDAQKITLTLSAPARGFLMAEAMRRGVSRTQVVEDMVLQLAESFPAPAKGKYAPQTCSGGSANNILSPSGGGLKTRLTRYQPARQAVRSSK
jgi:hypothetical protein